MKRRRNPGDAPPNRASGAHHILNPALLGEAARSAPSIVDFFGLGTLVYSVSLGLLPALIFAARRTLSGHIARIVMERSRLFFAWLLLVWIIVVGHGMLLCTYDSCSMAAVVLCHLTLCHLADFGTSL